MSDQEKKIFSIPIAIIIAGIIIGGAVIYTSKTGTDQPAEEGPGTAQVAPPEDEPKDAPTVKDIIVTENDNIRGNKSAPVTIVEFSDFQCSFCARFHPTLKQALDNYPEQVRWVYKHFPLDSIHPEARPSAEASECAAEQGKFWEFADGLSDNQSRLGADLYKELAGDFGLNQTQFDECVSSRKYKDKVQADMQEGGKIGVRGTPGTFVNGRQLAGAVPYSVVESAIKAALSELEE